LHGGDDNGNEQGKILETGTGQRLDIGRIAAPVEQVLGIGQQPQTGARFA
jgi:hypothetical protein